MILQTCRRAGASVGAAATLVGVTYSGYLTAVGVAASRALAERERTPLSADSSTRFQLVIPAHNEEAMIAETLQAVMALDYPSDLLDVHVIADNCTDLTALIARSFPVNVHERTAPDARGKGMALRWLIAKLPPGQPSDAIVILDADSIVEPSFLTALSARFERGSQVVQAYYAVRDEASGGEVSLRSAALSVRHLVRPAGRVELGGSSSLYGNGMAFTEEIARTFAWSSHLTEDLEMGLRLLLAGTKVDFEPLAVVRGEMPESRTHANSQHHRWETGRRGVARTYVPRLLNAAQEGSEGGRWIYLDAVFDIAMPPMGTLVATTGAGSLFLALFGRGSSRKAGIAGGSVGIALLVGHVLQSLRLAKAPPEVYRSLLGAPRNIIWKLGVLAESRHTDADEWVRTTRNVEVAG